MTKRNDTRLLTVKEQPWEYKIGRRTTVLYSPEGQKFYAENEDIEGGKKGRKYYEKEDEYRDTYGLGPAAIVNYIETKILGVEIPSHRRCESCEEVKTDVYLRINPYASEIMGDDSEDYYCNDCVSRMAEEI
jgi:hypothetical protein